MSVSGLALIAVFAINGVLALVPLNAKAVTEPITCKVEVVDCPGLGTGDRQVCHQNGDGLACTCGQSTVCP